MTSSEQPTTRPEQADGPPRPEALAHYFPHLEVESLLGHGGMGAVYLARQKALDRPVALKILPPDRSHGAGFTERFNREARALARLHHPNIVAVHDSGCVDGLCYLIMEYVDGTNLRRVMSAGKLSPREALQIIPELCEALQYAHDEGVLHRDIKPENILIDKRGRVKIADFGLAKLMRGNDDTVTECTLTQPQQMMGTMHYMAPEQLESPTKVDHRADIYALGVVFYEMLTGELPIGRFPLPSQKTPIDARLDEIVLHALEKDPDRRYQKASEVKTALSTFSASAGAAQPAPPPAARSAQAHQHRRVAHPPAGAATPPEGYSSSDYPSSSIIGLRKREYAYLLWLVCLVGGCGVHRMYAGRWVSGIIWLLTGGLCFVGQLVDLFLIPGMVEQANLEEHYRRQFRQQPLR